MGYRLSKLYTRTGDAGDTGLANGQRIRKDHPRVEAMGDVDELNSQLGLLLCQMDSDRLAPLKQALSPIQHRLFDLGGELAIPGHDLIEAADVTALEQLIDQLRRDGDSVGARLLVTAEGVPPGLGEPVFGKLDADIAAALMSINAVKGVEIGSGFASIEQRGSQHRDELTANGFQSNNAGGVLGGISSGQTLEAQIALKPTSSIMQPAQSLDTAGQPAEVVTKGRHDPCVGIRAVPIAESMLALVVMDHLLRHRAQNSDVNVTVPGLNLPQR